MPLRVGPPLFFLAFFGLWPGALSAAELPAATVGQAVALRRDRVAEFHLIKEAAEELGFRVWLFGGTAAGFAHYVRSDLAREAGDARYRESFFDYDFTNIYRSTQDADLVVDATPEQAEQLEERIREKMSFLQGSKDHWEVRLLRHPRTVGDQVKLPLLANPDFLEQNTDSNSTGMIELTDPPAGESVVRDLRDWESPTPFFLQDVTQGRLHYYLSPTHQKTSRFRSGDNPPIFSVIRYLVKAFQYDLSVDGEDLEKVRALIDAFEPKRDWAAMSPWARGWLERYGPNLFRHAVNIEYAWNTLEALGLRKKLISLSDPSSKDTLGWWLSKEPLRTRPVGTGPGRTAAELGIDTVAHETRDFLAYESITRDTTLKPNVFISRKGHPGENAVFGPGFYVKPGQKGAAGTGFTIRFRLDPQAREGRDFQVAGDYLVITNRAALTVIPETLEISILQYFRLLRRGAEKSRRDDRGVWMKLMRRARIQQQIGRTPLSPEELAEVISILDEAIDEKFEEKPRIQSGISYIPQHRFPPVLNAWFDSPLSLEHPEVVEAIIDRGTFTPYELICGVLRGPDWVSHPELVRKLIGRSAEVNGLLLSCLFTQEAWTAHPELPLEILEDGQLDQQTYPPGQASAGRRESTRPGRS